MVKFEQPARPLGEPVTEPVAAPIVADRRTRDRVCRTVLEQGPVSASHLAGRLGVRPPPVR